MMISYGSRRSNSEHFIQSPDATGQGTELIRLLHHDCFAVSKILTWNLYVHIITHSASLFHDTRDDTNGSSACFMHTFTNTFHESTVSSTVDEGVTILPYPFPQPFCHVEVGWIYIVVRRTKYCYLHLIYFSTKVVIFSQSYL